MNQAVGAQTNWGKSYASQYLTEQNLEEFERVVVVDYKDEFGGLVEAHDLKRLTVPAGAENISREKWMRLLEENPRIQLARTGASTEQFREAMATVIEALAELSGSTFLVLDEAHKLAPQKGKCPDAFETLATTWHGDGMGVLWITQRFTDLEETVLAECEASMLGGFSSPNDLRKIESVTYPVDIHNPRVDRVPQAVPDELLVDDEALALRRWQDDAGMVVGSEWIYADPSTVRRIDSREWELASTHYGSDRKRIKQPFDED